jgi:pimeloyl-ACP methyl ester carboxylesterase
MFQILLRAATAIFGLVASFTVVTAQVRPILPTILVPGILGSKLCTSNDEVVWGSAKSLMNLARLELPEPKGQQLKPCGLVEDIQVFGPLYSVKAYTALREALISEFGFKLKKDLFVFDYDWRLSTTENAKKLETFVAEKLGSKQEFNILAHSMGGLVSRIYMENTKNNPRVKTIIYMGTPFLGSVSTFGTLADGWGGIENWMAGGTETIRRVALSWPGMIELLPRYSKCCTLKAQNGTYTDVDPFDPVIWKQQKWLPALMQTGAAFESFKKRLTLAGSLTPLFQSAPARGIEVKFAGDARNTHFIFTAVLTADGTSPPDGGSWHFSKAPGDGTVRDLSAARDPQLRSLQGSLQSFAEHATIFDDKWVRVELKRELTIHPADTRPAVSGSGHPQIRPIVDGEERTWEIGTSEVTVPSSYLELGQNVKTSVLLTLDASPGLRPNVYAPIVQLRQGNDFRPLSVVDLTEQNDADNKQLRFSAEGSTGGFSEGAAEIVVSFPTASPPTSASAYIVLLRR